MGDIPDTVLYALGANKVVAYPTSTLPGLATLPTKEGLDALFALKKRHTSQPVSLGVISLEQASSLVEVPDFAHQLLNDFAQGTLTLILDAHEPLDNRLGGTRVAVRVFSHPVARALAKAVGPVTATSANRAGIEPLSDAESAGIELQLGQDSILPGSCPGGLGSTLVSIQKSTESPSGFSVSIMREGVIPASDVNLWMSKNH